MIKHQFKLMPQEMTTIIDPLAMDDELVVPKAPIPETATQVSNGFEETPMVNAFYITFLSTHILTRDVILRRSTRLAVPPVTHNLKSTMNLPARGKRA